MHVQIHKKDEIMPSISIHTHPALMAVGVARFGIRNNVLTLLAVNRAFFAVDPFENSSQYRTDDHVVR